MIITFYNEKINPDVIKYQKKVFDFFNLKINQIKPDIWNNHSGSIDDFITALDDWEYIVLFDIDAIPLNKHIVPNAIEWATNNIGLYSVAQNANHIKNSDDYASPAFLVFSKATYEILGKPSFVGTKRSDCAQELTHKARELNIEIKLLYPSHVNKPKWKFKNGTYFGIGTTYDGQIYHQFESRKTSSDFIKKCKSILNEKIR